MDVWCQAMQKFGQESFSPAIDFACKIQLGNANITLWYSIRTSLISTVTTLRTPFSARAGWSSTTRTTMPAPSQKGTKLGAKALPGSRTNRLGIPPPIQPTTLSQYVDAEASRDPLNESRASHNKRRHNEINGSYNSDKENDSDVASEGTPAAAKVGLRRA
jgi:hypothetical protein